MMQSFRLKLALLSALMSGLVLAAFGTGSWWLIRSLKMERMDSEIRSMAEREVGRNRDALAWGMEEGRISANLGIRSPAGLLLRVETINGQLIYQSPHWPDSLDAASLPWPSPQMPLAPPSAVGFSLISQVMAAQDKTPETAPTAIVLAQAPRPSGPPGPPPDFEPGFRPAPSGPGSGRPAHPPGFGPGPDGRRPLPGDGMLPWHEQPHPPLPDQRPPPPEAQQQSLPSPRLPEDAVQTPVRTAPVAAQAEPPAASPAVRVSEPLRTAEPSSAPGQQSPPSEANLPRFAPGFQSPTGPPAPAFKLMVQRINGIDWRMGLSSTIFKRLAVVVNPTVMDADMQGIRNGFLVVSPFALVLVGLASWLFAGRALKPVEKLAAAARRVTAQGLDQRISTAHEDREFIALIEMFNLMLARLERSFKQAHRFTADAAHELKTPLAIVQGQLERAISQADEHPTLQAGLSSTLDEVRRLSVISRKLLLLSQADAGRLTVHRERVDLTTVLKDLLEDTRMLAPHLRIDGQIAPALTLTADSSMLRQVLHNMISNAIKYNISNGWIRIAGSTGSKLVEVEVSNASKGIAKPAQEKLFERFFRADFSHSRHIEGVGLGLSVSREIARAHGGDLVLKGDSQQVVVFVLRLPR